MSESDFETQYAQEMQEFDQENQIEKDDIFSTGVFQTTTPFNKKQRNLEMPSSPGSILSPLFSNIQKTPMPSDLSVSTRKKPRFELESDDDDEVIMKQPRLDFDFQKNRFSSQLDIPSSPIGLSGVASSPIRQTQMEEDEFMSKRVRVRDLSSEIDPIPIELDRIQMEPHFDLEIDLSKPIERNFTRLPDTNLFRRGQSSNGTFLYFPQKRQKLYSYSNDGPLLSHHITVLMAQVKTDVNYDNGLRAQREMQEIAQNDVSSEKKLWVEKWKPVEYVDLVGEEYLNRLVLHWVKQWDFCVFKKEKRLLMPQKYKNPDRLSRPEKRIMLLSGPPGLGKTTLAYVIAKHCGYNIVEINASDDRTAAVFKSKVINALENKDIVNKKPNLVVIDEVDGVSGSGGESSFINLLVQLATPRPVHQTAGKKKQKELTRPIICICNDAYVPSLRPLRQIAYVVKFGKPSFQSLSTRLSQICEWEGVKTDLKTLQTLLEKTNGDLRSCLNTLQFLKQYTPIEMAEQIGKLNVGVKDLKMDWKEIAEQIFRKESGKQTLEKRMKELAGLVRDYGDYERLIQACFENYLSIELFDVSNSQTGTETRYVQQGHFLAFYDHLIKHIYEFQSHDLYQYLPYCVTSFHGLFSTAKQVALEYPKMGYQAEADRKQILGIATSLWSGMSIPNQSKYKNNTNTIMELAPFLLAIISEDFKPTNLQLLKPNEKKKLNRMVNLFVGFGLDLEKEKTEMNTLEYIIEPRLDLLVDLLPFCKDRRTITDNSYTVNQLIQHHVELERMRVKDAILQKKDGVTIPSTTSTPAKIRTERAVTLQDLVPTQIDKVVAEPKPRKDFFGRVIKKEAKKVDVVQVVVKKQGALYHFNEGYSNAVRKPAYMKDFHW